MQKPCVRLRCRGQSNGNANPNLGIFCHKKAQRSRAATKVQATEFFATKKHKNYQGSESNLPRVYKRDGDIAAATEILVLL